LGQDWRRQLDFDLEFDCGPSGIVLFQTLKDFIRKKEQMPNAKDLIATGNLAAAVQETTQQVRNHPTDLTARITLFELLCLMGDLDRAEKQLDVVEQQRSQKDLGVQVYRNCLKAERERRRVFEQGIEPHFLGEPPAYVDLHMEAIACIREGKFSQAREVLDRAEEDRPALSGKFNGKLFQDFRDCNDLTAAVLEVVVHDKYTWLPLEQIRQIEIDPPKQLRDILWASARIISANEVKGEVIIPALYAGTSVSSDDSARLGRVTDWQKLSDDLYRGVGLRLFLVDETDHPLFELESIEFDGASAAAQSPPA
jgi:type VI secretion system protein ImpE